MDHLFEHHHHLDTPPSHHFYHRVQLTLIIEQFLTVVRLLGTLLDLRTLHVIHNPIEERHLLRYHMREGTAMMICTYLIHLTINTSHSICITGIQHAGSFH